MNDELTAQLAIYGYTLPDYARPHLRVVTEHDTVSVEGESGLFSLSVPAALLDVQFGVGEGPLLRRFRWQPDSLEWDGRVRIGGTVEAITVTEFREVPIALLTVLGVPLIADAEAYIPATLRGTTNHAPPAFADGVIAADERFTTWLAPESSPLVAMAENALNNRLNVWVGGRLAPSAAGWQNVAALPLLLETATVFASL
jgi:hypothetical protein